MKGERKMSEKNEVKKNEKEELKNESDYKVVGKTKGSMAKKETKVSGKVTIGEKAQKQLNPEKKENKKEGKSKTKFIILAVVLAVILLVIISLASFGGRIANKVKLDKEMYDLFSGNVSIDNIEIKTTGDFAVVETAIKEYYKKVSDTQKQLMEIIQDEKIQNMLSIENYQADGPEFASSKEYINTSKTSLNQKADELAGYFSMEAIMAQIEDKKLGNYYVELYKKYFFNGEDLSEDFKQVYDEIDGTKTLMNNLYDNELKILNFLSENKNHWKIDGTKISFDSSAILAQYNSLKVQLNAQ